jgi:hypothetical protein
MATTTNYSWSTPDDTALVKDGAAAIRTLGSSADTTVKALNPGTTAGDIDYYTTSTAKARVAIGTAGQVLAVNSGATAPEWITSSSGGMTSLASGSIAASATGFDLTSISSDYNDLCLYIRNFSMTESSTLRFRINNITGTDYAQNTNNFTTTFGTDVATSVFIVSGVTAAQTGQSAYVYFQDYKNTTAFKQFNFSGTQQDNVFYFGSGFTRKTEAISRLTVFCSAGTFDAGTYELFGVK